MKLTRPRDPAHAAEERGDFARAAALFAEKGEWEDAARATLLAGDASEDDAERLRLYARAVAIAPERSAVAADARKKRAISVLARGETAPLTRALRLELVLAGRDLEDGGEHQRAAQAYACAEDFEGQARALARAGAVDALESVLAADLARRHDERSLRNAEADFASLVRSGSRREAVLLARAHADEGLRERGRAIEERRVRGSVIQARLRGRDTYWVLGDEIVVGRAPDDTGGPRVGVITVPSAALSRLHLAIVRRAGDVFVRDLASRNGTTASGQPIVGDRPVGDGLELQLGCTVNLVLRRDPESATGLLIEVGGRWYVAPLGPAAPLGIGRWRLERSEDGWIELVTDDAPPAFAAGLQLARRIALLAGDAVGAARQGAPDWVVVDRPLV